MLKKVWQWIRFGKIVEVQTKIDKKGSCYEVWYLGRFRRVVGIKVYGEWDKSLPYRG